MRPRHRPRSRALTEGPREAESAGVEVGVLVNRAARVRPADSRAGLKDGVPPPGFRPGERGRGDDGDWSGLEGRVGF